MLRQLSQNALIQTVVQHARCGQINLVLGVKEELETGNAKVVQERRGSL